MGLSLCCCLLITIFLAPIAQAQSRSSFDLPAQSLATSLRVVASQTGTNVLFDPPLVEGRVAPALKAQLTLDQAFTKLLSGTGLSYKYLDEKTVTIASRESSAAADSPRSDQTATSPEANSNKEAGKDTSQDFRVAQVDQNAVRVQTVGDYQNSEKKKKDEGLTEIVVTGTNILGAANSPSPVQVYTRADIENTGVGTVAQFIQTLPQNFNGGASENTISNVTGGGTINNSVGGTGVNLRGIGNDSTIVLINGHRVAPGNAGGNFVDISMIPLSAIERIEVVTDGASAIYGSDAIGGVVNFILRQHFDGQETTARYAAVTSGSSHESQVGQTVGRDWGDGSALVSYEFYDRTPLSAASRSFSDTAQLPFSLLPEQVRQSVLASANQALSANVSLYANGTYSRRATHSDTGIVDDFQEHDAVNIDSYSGTLGAKTELSPTTELELSASYSASRTHVREFFAGEGLQGDIKAVTSILSTDAVLRGTLGSVSAGPVRYALGAQYRKEAFDSDDLLAFTDFSPTRNIAAAFAELRLPIIGPGQEVSRGARLELSVADRFEHYSDFGDTNNPQFGLIWRALPSLNLRGTAGTSFKAPTLSDLNPMISQAVLYPLTDLREGQSSCEPLGPGNNCTNTLIVFGTNSHLTPQKARTWTLGLDFTPQIVDGVRASTTYYNINYKDQIENLQGEFNLVNAFGLESILGPTILQRNPSPALVSQFTTIPAFLNPFGISPTATGALLDLRTRNLAIVDTRGVDFDVSYKTKQAIGDIETGIVASRILVFNNQITPEAPASSLLNTSYNPLKWKVRGRIVFGHGDLTTALFLNYQNSYQDPGTTPPAGVASWTTVDFTARYTCHGCSGFADGLEAMLGIQNVANRAPPFVENAGGFGVNFDGANSSALGRYVSLELRKKW
jgi:iron complex outermembrane receptor protein